MQRPWRAAALTTRQPTPVLAVFSALLVKAARVRSLLPPGGLASQQLGKLEDEIAEAAGEIAGIASWPARVGSGCVSKFVSKLADHNAFAPDSPG